MKAMYTVTAKIMGCLENMTRGFSRIWEARAPKEIFFASLGGSPTAVAGLLVLALYLVFQYRHLVRLGVLKGSDEGGTGKHGQQPKYPRKESGPYSCE
jgi:hypothetical protein